MRIGEGHTSLGTLLGDSKQWGSTTTRHCQRLMPWSRVYHDGDGDHGDHSNHGDHGDVDDADDDDNDDDDEDDCRRH